ncbi:MAG: hypothetical protein CNLJKLNK_01333 [Holosporales bacterium]
MYIEKLFLDLKQFSDFNKKENIDCFLETIDNIVKLKNPQCIKEIIKYFDDNNEYSWVFESLIHSLECFEDDIYVTELIKNYHRMISNGKNWFFIMLNRLLNNDACFIVLKNIFKKGYYVNPIILNEFEKEYPHHQNIINELRKILNQN